MEGKRLKEKLNGLPQIDATFQFNSSKEYANELMDDLLRYFTLNQIEAHTGICRRNLSYFRHKGISTFPMQLTLEILAGRVELDG
jgi:hypothetical protein